MISPSLVLSRSIAPTLGFLSIVVPASTRAAVPFSQFVDPHPSPGNQFGATVLALSTGNVVVTSPYCDFNGPNTGSVYLFNGATGALISELHGSSFDDRIGSDGVTALSNGNYVIRTQQWDRGSVVNVGAVTWGSGTTGVSGVVSEANSLIGSASNDRVGSGRITVLSGGGYVVQSPSWDNGPVNSAGAVTWGNGTTGISGVVGPANSLVGSKSNDFGGQTQVHALAGNGNFVVASPVWDNGSTVDVGAVTWGNGATGISGTVSASNSLIGNADGDQVGTGLTVLANGNYVVRTPGWNNGAVTDVGAVTWASGTTGITGLITAGNSLVGTTASDQVGLVVRGLVSGHYVVGSSRWDNGPVSDAGAATWANGTTGLTGAVTASNSLVGGAANDRTGSGVSALANGNYVVASSWANGSGAVTWCQGSSATVGVVGAGNSLVGSTANDNVGTVLSLTNGHYAVVSPDWDNGAIVDAGAVTWCNGTSVTSGVVSAANSLVGSSASDKLGFRGANALSNGNYLVVSTSWDHGAVVDAGAVTWGNGSGGTIGPVGSANSLIGSRTGDLTDASAIALTNGNYVVLSPAWDNGTVTDAGAATWGNGSTGIRGVISPVNSLVGTAAGDGVGNGMIAFPNGNYAVSSPAWNHGSMPNVGAVTWGSGSAGIRGPVAISNSLIGLAAESSLQSLVADNVNGTFFARFLFEAGGIVRVGSQLEGIGTPATVSVSVGATILADGSSVPVIFGAPPLGTGVVRTFTIANSGGSDLLLGAISKSGDHAAEFAVGPPESLTVPPGGSTSFSVTFTPLASGSRNAVIHIGNSVGGAADPFDIALSGGQPTFAEWAASAGLQGADAAASATPFGDGVSNLLKYAFNLTGSGPDTKVMTAGGTSGLPLVERIDVGGQGVLRVVYLRRVGSGLIYTPQSSTDLGGFAPMTATPVVTAIDGQWERVIVEQSSPLDTVPRNFARVQVIAP